ncbi:MAG: hypothetical protein ABEH64_03670 [Salinirussus sp.]
MASLGGDAVKSFQLLWEAERWFPVSVVVGAIGFVLWVRGTAIGASMIGFRTLMEPWTAVTDALVALSLFVWIVLPAGLAAWFVRDRLTTDRGAIAVGYRLHHPLLLLVPPVIVITACAITVDRIGAVYPLVALLLIGIAWLVVRTVAYAYRVFALSLPVVGHTITFLTVAGFAIATVTVAAIPLGLGDLPVAIVEGLEARTGVADLSLLVEETVALRGVTVPAAVAIAGAVPTGLSAAYIVLQLVAGVIARLVRPTVRRPELRAGQRYPTFARPTTGISQAPPSPPGGRAEPDGADQESDTAAAKPSESEGESPVADSSEPESSDDHDPLSYDLRNTRVYRPSEDADIADPHPAAIANGAQQCPACGAELDDDGTCPECRSER